MAKAIDLLLALSQSDGELHRQENLNIFCFYMYMDTRIVKLIVLNITLITKLAISSYTIYLRSDGFAII